MREPFFLCLSQRGRYGGFPCVNGDVIDEDVGSLVLDVLEVAYAFLADTRRNFASSSRTPSKIVLSRNNKDGLDAS